MAETPSPDDDDDGDDDNDDNNYEHDEHDANNNDDDDDGDNDEDVNNGDDYHDDGGHVDHDDQKRMKQSGVDSGQTNGHPKMNFYNWNHPDTNNEMLTWCVKAFLKAMVDPYYGKPI